MESQTHRWNTAVLGCRWGSRLIKCAMQRDDVRIVAVADTDRERATHAADSAGASVYSQYQDAIADPDLDVAFIALPSELHRDAAMACIDRGLHVYLEKPCGKRRAAEEVLDVAQAARRKGVHVMAGFSQRFAAYVMDTRKTVDSGCLGRIVTVDILRQAAFGRESTDAPGWGVHDYDLCTLLSGADPDSVTAFSPCVTGIPATQTVETMIRHKNGVLSRCRTSMDATHLDVTIRVQGTTGELVASRTSQCIRIWEGRNEREIRHYETSDFLESAVHCFLNFLGGGTEMPPTIESIVPARRIMQAAYESVESGETVHLSDGYDR